MTKQGNTRRRLLVTVICLAWVAVSDAPPLASSSSRGLFLRKRFVKKEKVT